MLVSPSTVCWHFDNQVLPLKNYITYNDELDKDYLLDSLEKLDDHLSEFEETKEKLESLEEDKEKALSWLNDWFKLKDEDKLSPKALDILKTVQSMLEE